MIKAKLNNSFKTKWLIVMFFLTGMIVYAQDSTMMQPPSTQSPTGQSSTSSETPQSTQSPRSQDLSFNTDAAQLSNELVTKTGISTDKADKITEILVDYRNNLAKAKNKYYEDHPNATDNSNVTGGQSKVDMTDILGDNVEQYYTGVAPDLLSDYKDADKKADNQIKDVFDNDVQKSRYEQAKGQWWSDVKNKVFSSLSQNSQNSQNQMK